jgi:4-hydroxy-tetrahydrodipicolinate synthase
MGMKSINTVYCAAVTPMNAKFEIDYSGFDANIEWYIKNNLGGILVCGGTGEFVSLTARERMEIVDHVTNKIAGRTGLMVGCSAETTAEAIMFAKNAQQAGADGLLLIASYYFKPSEEELYQHFKAVADAVQIPVVLYNNPGACGTDLSPRFIQRMSAFENVKHVKEATGDLLRARKIRQVCGKAFNVMVGCDALAYELFKNGASGWISITANALASQSQEIFENMMKGNDSLAWKIYEQYLPIYTICEEPYKAIQTIKYIMDRIGCYGGESRLPRQPLTAEEKADVDVLLHHCGLI